jgi:rRNA maturation protein Nop10
MTWLELRKRVPALRPGRPLRFWPIDDGWSRYKAALTEEPTLEAGLDARNVIPGEVPESITPTSRMTWLELRIWVPALRPARPLRFWPIDDGWSRYRAALTEEPTLDAGLGARNVIPGEVPESITPASRMTWLELRIWVPALRPGRPLRFWPIDDGWSRYRAALTEEPTLDARLGAAMDGPVKPDPDGALAQTEKRQP